MWRVVLPSVLVFAMSPGRASAQQLPLPNMFPTLESCEEALITGKLRFYEPKYFGLNTRDLPNGADRVVVPLESDTCLEMLVVGGRKFVAQREETLFRAHKRADGSLELYARHDCGNPVYGVVYNPEPVLRDPVFVDESRLRWPEREDVVTPPLRQFPVEKSSGFCRSKKCRVAVALIGGAAVGYTAWRFWPCPPGTARK